MKKVYLFLLALLIPSITSAHVGYVIGEEARVAKRGLDWSFLSSVFHDPMNVTLMIVTAIIVIALVILVPQTRWFKHWSTRILEQLGSYGDFLPWMARLSLGIALIGAGTEGVLISPVAHTFAPFPNIEILLGFCFLVGFLLVPATLVAIMLYLIAVFNNLYVVGNLDFLALAIAYLGLHSERPGVDDIFNFKLLYGFRLPRSWVPFILRVGIGGAMIYLALYEKILNPHMSELVVQNYHLMNVIPVTPAMWVVSVGIIELIVGSMLLKGFYTRFVSVVAFAILSLSFFYFKESVTSHVTLFGLLSILFVMGGGAWSIDSWMAKRFQTGKTIEEL